MAAIFVAIALSALVGRGGWFIAFLPASIVWVALDSWRAQFWRYQSSISVGPTVVIFLFLLIGWPDVFPGYLKWVAALLPGFVFCAAADSRHTKFLVYRGGGPVGPTAYILLFLFFAWPVVFPWYLGMRLKILVGAAPLREDLAAWKLSEAAVGSEGLLQPWRGRKFGPYLPNAWRKNGSKPCALK